MLGQDLVSAAEGAGFTVCGFDLPLVDLTRPPTLEAHLEDADWWINCAAYTRVDDAEQAEREAYAVNSEGVRALARLAHRRRVPLLHISTDYVFDGRSDEPYGEAHTPNPLNVYGASKWAGEQALQAVGGTYAVVRTQSLFGHHGPNFVRAILGKVQAGDAPLRVVNDQVSAPTYTAHLAAGLCRLLLLNPRGTFHLTAAGACSWYDFARAIVAAVRPEFPVEPMTSAGLQRPAPRPAHAILCNDRYAEWTGHALPSWQEGLAAYLQQEGDST